MIMVETDFRMAATEYSTSRIMMPFATAAKSITADVPMPAEISSVTVFRYWGATSVIRDAKNEISIPA